MKTMFKILLLILFSVGAVAGVLMFEKTRVSPPSSLEWVDQYSIDLSSSCAAFESVKEFNQGRGEYLRLDDRLRRYVAENVMDAKTADKYRKRIDGTYGKILGSYGFGLLQKSEWPEEKLIELQALVAALKADRLSDGVVAVSDDFIATADSLNSIISDYRDAMQLAANVSYNGMEDATSKIDRAKTYSSADYLRNNEALVAALDTLPARLAQAHYNYVGGCINALKRYTVVEKDYYMNTLIPGADKAIIEYKNAKIYGESKPNVADLEKRAVSLVTDAMNYYDSHLQTN